MLRFGAQHVIVTKLVHLWCTLKKQRFPMVFNDFHVTHLARSSRSERACRDPLRRCVAVGGDHPVELFIFTRFLKGFGLLIRFWFIDKVDILNIDAASGIPKAPPQKHKENQCFLKGPLVGSSGDVTTHFAPARKSRRAALWNCSFSQGF